TALQAAMDEAASAGKVLVINENYLVDVETGLNVPSGSEIVWEGAGCLTAIPTDFGRHIILRLLNKNNVKLVRPKLVGERDDHLGTTGEWGYGIGLGGASDVEIVEPDVSKMWGDGIYVGVRLPKGGTD